MFSIINSVKVSFSTIPRPNPDGVLGHILASFLETDPFLMGICVGTIILYAILVLKDFVFQGERPSPIPSPAPARSNFDDKAFFLWISKRYEGKVKEKVEEAKRNVDKANEIFEKAKKNVEEVNKDFEKTKEDSEKIKKWIEKVIKGINNPTEYKKSTSVKEDVAGEKDFPSNPIATLPEMIRLSYFLSADVQDVRFKLIANRSEPFKVHWTQAQCQQRSNEMLREEWAKEPGLTYEGWCKKNGWIEAMTLYLAHTEDIKEETNNETNDGENISAQSMDQSTTIGSERFDTEKVLAERITQRNIPTEEAINPSTQSEIQSPTQNSKEEISLLFAEALNIVSDIKIGGGTFQQFFADTFFQRGDWMGEKWVYKRLKEWSNRVDYFPTTEDEKRALEVWKKCALKIKGKKSDDEEEDDEDDEDEDEEDDDDDDDDHDSDDEEDEDDDADDEDDDEDEDEDDDDDDDGDVADAASTDDEGYEATDEVEDDTPENSITHDSDGYYTEDEDSGIDCSADIDGTWEG
ncbi:hypothetical protein DSL72_000744 [Monilinia vaccinii-corymbosi]|uniref:Uncharacterized protein n=1 Tax=Monilinia vaccinii-corymbosi TaxID=61207 RepID=A0A8A3P6T3_9HELO|nr:hypothetical protein DSL72_000744 [Monilinia vaccinii-corymbosi]